MAAIVCPNCGSMKVHCWQLLRFHCNAYRDDEDGTIGAIAYGSANDDEHLEENSGGVKLDCDSCKHEWSEPYQEKW